MNHCTALRESFSLHGGREGVLGNCPRGDRIHCKWVPVKALSHRWPALRSHVSQERGRGEERRGAMGGRCSRIGRGAPAAPPLPSLLPLASSAALGKFMWGGSRPPSLLTQIPFRPPPLREAHRVEARRRRVDGVVPCAVGMLSALAANRWGKERGKKGILLLVPDVPSPSPRTRPTAFARRRRGRRRSCGE